MTNCIRLSENLRSCAARVRVVERPAKTGALRNGVPPQALVFLAGEVPTRFIFRRTSGLRHVMLTVHRGTAGAALEHFQRYTSRFKSLEFRECRQRLLTGDLAGAFPHSLVF